MKLSLLYTLFIAVSVPLAGFGQSIFFTDFESDAVGATTADGEVSGFFADRPGGIIRDSSVSAPFGSNNQYLEFSGANSRAIVSGATTLDFADSIVALSVNFYDSGLGTAGFGTRLGLGTGQFADTQDLNPSGSLFSVRLRSSDTTVNADLNTSIVSGSFGGYSLNTAYRMSYIFNLTGASQLVEGIDGSTVNLAPMQAAFGMENLGTGDYSNLAVLGTSNAIDNTIAVVFRNFSGDETVAYYDDLSVSSVSPIPEPSTYAAIFGLAALAFVYLRRRTGAVKRDAA